ncbi:MAG: family deacetylase [Actinoallomurus sp.]|nr:family deacetylase [Actinoallomurus sp.]
MPSRATSGVPLERARARMALPTVRSVLAVVARPGEEACYLGAVLDALHGQGSTVGVLACTCGQASAYNDSLEQLDPIGPFEFYAAGSALRTAHRIMVDYPDGELSRLPVERLAEHVIRAIREWDVDLLLTIAGRIADRTAAYAACRAGRECDVPVLGWTMPHGVARAVRQASGVAVTGDADRHIDFELRVRRKNQRYAMRAHHSQWGGDGAQLTRLAFQHDREWLRWLVPPSSPLAEPAPKQVRP